MRFTEHFGVSRPADADWFDLNVFMDTPLYVDPFLVFDDVEPEWSGTHDEIVDFFASALDLIKRAQGQETSLHWEKALRFLLFPEPKEFALGLSMGHPEGSGIGPDLALEICRALDLFRAWGRDADDRMLGMIGVLVPGMGVDRISDMVCNILKHRFVAYTQDACSGAGVATQELRVVNASWTAQGTRWRDSKVGLPASPAFEGPILLAPERFLKDIPRVTPEGFWAWAEHNENEALRFELNYDLAESLTRRQKAERGRQLARRSPSMLSDYVGEATSSPTPYDVSGDPDGLVRWEEKGREIADAMRHPGVPATQEDFESWLLHLADGFKSAVEEGGLWRALWDDPVGGNYGRHRKESITQVIARSAWLQQCKAADIDISREADCGRGPVDFKFSRGWSMRGLLEVKHIASTQFAHGASTQLPMYLRGESAPFGIYLCVGYNDRDFGAERIELVEAACSAVSHEGATRVVPMFVDARPKPSASRA